MAASWSKDDLEKLMISATPIVQKFLRGLSAKGTATAEQLGVHHMAPVIGLRYSKSRGKEPLYSSKKDPKTGHSVFMMSPKYKSDIAKFMSTHRVIPRPPAQPKRPVGRPRKNAIPEHTAARSAAATRSWRKSATRTAAAATVGKSVRRGPGRFPRSASGSFTLPSNALREWTFWTELVAFANSATKRGAGLLLETDGASVQVRASR